MVARGREAVHRLGEIRRSRRLKALAVLSGLAYALLYLFSLGHLVFRPGMMAVPGGGLFTVTELENLWRERAPFNFEPIAVFQPVEGVALFLAVPNLLLAAGLGLLLGLNMAALVYAYGRTRACGITHTVGGLAVSVPALLTGFACCSPTFLLLLGAAFSTSFVFLVGWFLPGALAALVAVLAWNLLRTLPTASLPTLAAEV